MKFTENSKFKTDLKFRFNFEIGAIGRRWENSRLATPVDRPVDWAVDLARTKSTALSTWVSTGGARPVWPDAPFLGLAVFWGCFLEASEI